MKKERGRQLTAAEALAKLESDPVYVSRQWERDRVLNERAAQYRAEQAPLLDELRRVGLSVQSVWDLVNTSANYEEAIPILLRHVVRPYSEKTKEGIARALAVPEARGAWYTLVSEYRKTPEIKGGAAKSGLAVALAAIATDAVIDELIGLVKDRSNGRSRIFFVRALKKSKTLEARQALEELVSDPYLGKEVVSSRRR